MIKNTQGLINYVKLINPEYISGTLSDITNKLTGKTLFLNLITDPLSSEDLVYILKLLNTDNHIIIIADELVPKRYLLQTLKLFI